MKKTNTTTDTNYVQHLEKNLDELLRMLTDPALWHFLSDSERLRVDKVVQNKTAYRFV